MSFKKILHDIETARAEDFKKVSDRRNVLKSLGTTMAAVALPLSVSSLLKSGGPSKSAIVSALNTALEFKYFGYAFYHTANNTAGLIPEGHAAEFKTIEVHEKSHIDFYTKTIEQLGGTAFRPQSTSYGFTKVGMKSVFSDFGAFLATSLAIENVGLAANNELLAAVAGSNVFGKVQQLATTKSRHATQLKMTQMAHVYGNDVSAEFLVNNFAPKNTDLEGNITVRSRYRNLGLV